MNKGTTVHRLFLVALLVSVGFLGVVFGMVAHKFKLWPHSIFQNAYQAARAWHEKLTPRSQYDTTLFQTALYANSGIFRYDE